MVEPHFSIWPESTTATVANSKRSAVRRSHFARFHAISTKPLVILRVPASEHVERRLEAILAADVAGYSRLMGTDEEGTLAQLKAYRKTLVDPLERVR